MSLPTFQFEEGQVASETWVDQLFEASNPPVNRSNRRTNPERNAETAERDLASEDEWRQLRREREQVHRQTVDHLRPQNMRYSDEEDSDEEASFVFNRYTNEYTRRYEDDEATLLYESVHPEAPRNYTELTTQRQATMNHPRRSASSTWSALFLSRSATRADDSNRRSVRLERRRYYLKKWFLKWPARAIAFPFQVIHRRYRRRSTDPFPLASGPSSENGDSESTVEREVNTPERETFTDFTFDARFPAEPNQESEAREPSFFERFGYFGPQSNDIEHVMDHLEEIFDDPSARGLVDDVRRRMAVDRGDTDESYHNFLNSFVAAIESVVAEFERDDGTAAESDCSDFIADGNDAIHDNDDDDNATASCDDVIKIELFELDGGTHREAHPNLRVSTFVGAVPDFLLR